MIKVIIADDEALEREVYKVILARNFTSVSVVAEAETGRQAIEQFDIHKPDIILMDVKMPGINGINAIEEIRKRRGKSKIIVISAYNFFDYAKEALKYGIEDYILKPVAKDEFIKVVGAAIQKIEHENMLNKEELEIKEKLKYIMPLVENEVAFAVMMGEDEKIGEYAHLLDIDISSGYLVVGKIDEKSLPSSDEVSKNFTVRKIQEYIKNNMPELKPCLISNFYSNKILFILPYRMEQKHDLKEHSYKKILGVRNKIKDNFLVKMSFGISEAYNGLGLIRNSYNQALTVINNIDSFEIDIINFGDIKSNAFRQFQYPYELEHLLTEKIRLGLTELAMGLFVEIFDYTSTCLKEDVNRVKFELLELYFTLSRMAFEYDVPCTDLDGFIMSRNKYYNLLTVQEIYHIFDEEIRSLCVKFNEERNKKAKKTMFQAVQFIKENFMKEITLEDVAKKVCISPNYFSRMFKNEFNQSFIDYLTKVRIDNAKAMILKAGKSISDICWDVGYNDPNYFTKVFKKVSGLTPSEFKEQSLKNK